MPDTAGLWAALRRGNPTDEDLREVFEATPENEREALANSVGFDGPPLYRALVSRHAAREKKHFLLANKADPITTAVFISEQQKSPRVTQRMMFELLLGVGRQIDLVGREKAQLLADAYNQAFPHVEPFVFRVPSRDQRKTTVRTSEQAPSAAEAALR